VSVRAALRPLWFLAGLALAGVGVIGAIVPLLPSTIFFILAAACFARCSPRLEAWLLARPHIGPAISDWRARGAIARPAKIAASSGMAVGAIALLAATPDWPWRLAGWAALAACAVFVWRRPE
jgi:uncharacterized membrane protein YbaN (DUF454 family)